MIRYFDSRFPTPLSGLHAGDPASRCCETRNSRTSTARLNRFPTSATIAFGAGAQSRAIAPGLPIRMSFLTLHPSSIARMHFKMSPSNSEFGLWSPKANSTAVPSSGQKDIAVLKISSDVEVIWRQNLGHKAVSHQFAEHAMQFTLYTRSPRAPFRIPESPSRTVEVHAGHCDALFPTQLQS